MHSESLAERVLWKKLKGRALYGYRFLRRKKFGNVLCSFYCPKIRLAVAVDGKNATPDIEQKFRIHLLRVDPFEIYRNRDTVLKIIAQQLPHPAFRPMALSGHPNPTTPSQ